jgi:hypothetical protein
MISLGIIVSNILGIIILGIIYHNIYGLYIGYYDPQTIMIPNIYELWSILMVNNH